MKNNRLPPLYLLLASMSRYRAECLQKLQKPFEQWAPHIDEAPLSSETPEDMVIRLAIQKARAGITYLDNTTNPKRISHVLASDQAMVLNGKTLGKPHTIEKAREQLTAMSGQTVIFYTSLCLTEVSSQEQQASIDTTHVHFRELSPLQIETYLQMESPLDCAGSFKSEGAGIVLCHSIEGKDPNALIGLPLILLTDMLYQFGYSCP